MSIASRLRPRRVALDDTPSPVTRGGLIGRILGMLVLSAIGVLSVAASQIDADPLYLVADLSIGVFSYLLVWWRRRWPLPLAIMLNLVTVFSGSALGPAILVAVSVATRRRWREVVLCGLAMVAAGIGFDQFQPTTDKTALWITATANIAAAAAVLAWGMYLGSQRDLVTTLEQRAERAEAAQELRSQKARTDERARIAREMHDVLAHRISQISMHAGALAFREDLDSPALREGLSQVKARSDEALADLRDVLGVLRDPDTGEPTSRPQPGFGDIEELIASVRNTGTHVRYDARVGEGEMPTMVGRTIYRVVQEGLTNAARHAPGSTVEVTVSGGPETGIDLRIRNPLGFGPATTAGAGLGLLGLRERVELRGGEIQAEQDGGSFVLEVWIPWRP